MIGEIIAIGDELTTGRIANTTSGFAARHLFTAGYDNELILLLLPVDLDPLPMI